RHHRRPGVLHVRGARSGRAHLARALSRGAGVDPARGGAPKVQADARLGDSTRCGGETRVSEWPFHPGELEAQVRAGGGSTGGGIVDFMTGQHRTFYAALPFVVVGSVDADWPTATILAGEPGFVTAPDPWTLRIRAALDAADPAQRTLVSGAPVGILGID